MENIVVKPLEWEETDERWWGATPIYGLVYEVRTTDRGTTRVRWPENGGWDEFDGNLDEAKAVMQADFDKRVRAVLASPHPVGDDR
ncbi:hypothetical protein EN814_09830 [Mesorhizobium sp. M2D.F.Ca.ET.171.01.1.1]|nr:MULTISPECIES: hypothetical protein [unclassified Mesorhizobium]TGT97824.1 hypothetical protein EN806_48455 [bacterium M00.F.Ca.ET.163.01.1.1]TGU44609.1 hypothetical protein EN789_21640 [bacterium M00.F.Ca.ET.146.01.1.1]TGW09945.1 hypothetical protein EN788_22090 [Mesorhizobium sp. M2D.F.Ca.ET.145.01.1.1]TGS97484.1 hypothetical protein EN821_09830 [Mesorhizobium sp. M2D.F.Ca.ET.178.01.1.1]TGT12054.1 hypothetical protein EN814_09830 [Mesorhizobium sp. M2D.F.Ca.ET.171.01.1.1]